MLKDGFPRARHRLGIAPGTTTAGRRSVGYRRKVLRRNLMRCFHLLRRALSRQGNETVRLFRDDRTLRTVHDALYRVDPPPSVRSI